MDSRSFNVISEDFFYSVEVINKFRDNFLNLSKKFNNTKTTFDDTLSFLISNYSDKFPKNHLNLIVLNSLASSQSFSVDLNKLIFYFLHIDLIVKKGELIKLKYCNNIDDVTIDIEDILTLVGILISVTSFFISSPILTIGGIAISVKAFESSTLKKRIIEDCTIGNKLDKLKYEKFIISFFKSASDVLLETQSILNEKFVELDNSFSRYLDTLLNITIELKNKAEMSF